MARPPAGDGERKREAGRKRADDRRGNVDRSIRVILPEAGAEVAGAVLMELLGPFEQELLGGDDERSCAGDGMVALVFYPPAGMTPGLDELAALLPPALGRAGRMRMETREVSRDWVEGWRDYFRPTRIGEACIRPPWVPAPPAAAGFGRGASRVPVDVVINPGLGFGTGLHPTTRGTLRLLQEAGCKVRGALVDVGTGSGVLAIAAAKLGWAPVTAFDNDPAALISARENVEANGVQEAVNLHETDVAGARLEWFARATVLANMTLEPVSVLLRRFSGGSAAPGPAASFGPSVRPRATTPAGPSHPRRLVISGILADGQERELLTIARESGFVPGRRVYETEWVSLELFPTLLED